MHHYLKLVVYQYIEAIVLVQWFFDGFSMVCTLLLDKPPVPCQHDRIGMQFVRIRCMSELGN